MLCKADGVQGRDATQLYMIAERFRVEGSI